MFDHKTEETAHWADDIQRGDIVLFRFPVRNSQAADGLPVARPCLVMEVDGEGENQRLVLAYGTSRIAATNTGYDIAVKGVELRAAGMTRPTRFIGARLLSVSPNHSGLMTGDLGTPLVGRLTGKSLDRMHWVRGRLHAEHDIAAERRRENTPRTVMVEHRARRMATPGRPKAA
ncbi:hypothetical protein SAMN05421762_1184 [Pseudooceanicola nitratireducens]|uniref:PemK-like, MazF-like toxin of type II toxin-antitoxin system n=1 Tax=Pseudooceanicola nitratireducens TaxID=517719 RepID=A0A1I1JT26_9RHOB|nr:hypothetical protein [Pseudooceanicola nitratireducens]SEJ52120.1 hypothetical protein SAMN05216183_103609 [Pseudooceanicola nitratireducens]SFC51797.1 hypothetical protein SAMN05421762_1184 [Pseudooceanicola nitratireducens]